MSSGRFKLFVGSVQKELAAECRAIADSLRGDALAAKSTRPAAEVAQLLNALSGEMTRQQWQRVLRLRHDEHFRKAYLQPALTPG